MTTTQEQIKALQVQLREAQAPVDKLENELRESTSALAAAAAAMRELLAEPNPDVDEHGRLRSVIEIRESRHAELKRKHSEALAPVEALGKRIHSKRCGPSKSKTKRSKDSKRRWIAKQPKPRRRSKPNMRRSASGDNSKSSATQSATGKRCVGPIRHGSMAQRQ